MKLLKSTPFKKVILVTGASTGLGLAISKELLKDSENFLILTSRESSLERFQKEGIHEGDQLWIRPLDVTDRAQREQLVSEILGELDRVDVLINNAGVAYRAVMEHAEPYELARQMHINYFAPLELIRLVLPSMRAQKSGQIVNISSVAGMMSMPTMGLYSSSKFALEAMSESLWYELKPYGINVNLIEPGFIQSDAFEKTPWSRQAKLSQQSKSAPYHYHYASMSEFIARLMKFTSARPDSVARIVSKVIRKRSAKLRFPATLDAWVFHLMRHLLPSSIYMNILYRSLPRISRWSQSNHRGSLFANFLLCDPVRNHSVVRPNEFHDEPDFVEERQSLPQI